MILWCWSLKVKPIWILLVIILKRFVLNDVFASCRNQASIGLEPGRDGLAILQLFRSDLINNGDICHNLNISSLNYRRRIIIHCFCTV